MGTLQKMQPETSNFDNKKLVITIQQQATMIRYLIIPEALAEALLIWFNVAV